VHHVQALSHWPRVTTLQCEMLEPLVEKDSGSLSESGIAVRSEGEWSPTKGVL